MSASMMAMRVYATLRNATLSCGLTQAVIATKIGVTREHFNRVLNAGAELSSDQLFIWADIVGVSIVIDKSHVGEI